MGGLTARARGAVGEFSKGMHAASAGLSAHQRSEWDSRRATAGLDHIGCREGRLIVAWRVWGRSLSSTVIGRGGRR